MPETAKPQAKVAFAPVSPLASVWRPGEHGRIGAAGPGVTFTERRDLAAVSLQARRDGAAALAARLEAVFGLALPEPCGSRAGNALSLVWTGLDRWLAIAGDGDGPALADRLRAAVGDAAAVVDQSHGLAALQLDGPLTGTVLGKGTPVDLHERAFPIGRVAATGMNHTSVLLWRTGESRWLLLVHRGFARDLYAFLTTMAREVGYRVTG